MVPWLKAVRWCLSMQAWSRLFLLGLAGILVKSEKGAILLLGLASILVRSKKGLFWWYSAAVLWDRQRYYDMYYISRLPL